MEKRAVTRQGGGVSWLYGSSGSGSAYPIVVELCRWLRLNCEEVRKRGERRKVRVTSPSPAGSQGGAEVSACMRLNSFVTSAAVLGGR